MMSSIQEKVSSFCTGFYTWMVTVFFGAVLLDVVYSNQVPEAAPAFSDITDFLLLIGLVTFLGAVGAITFSWKSSSARTFFIASFVILLFEFMVPVIFSQYITSQGLGLGTAIRLIINGTASMLAFIGLHKFYQNK